MKLSAFVSALAWVSLFGMSWLLMLGRIDFETTWWFFVMFWVIAMAGGAISMVNVNERKPPMR